MGEQSIRFEEVGRIVEDPLAPAASGTTARELLDLEADDLGLALPASEPDLVARADELLLALGDLQAERQANAGALKIETDRLRARYQFLDRTLERRETGLLAHLKAIWEALPHRGKTKSRALASGRLGTRKQSARYQITDRDAVIAFLQEHADPVEVATIIVTKAEVAVDHAKLVEYITRVGRGSPPPGVLLIPEAEHFFAKPEA